MIENVYSQLDSYEQVIVDTLIEEYGYDRQRAICEVQTYLPVLERLGYYESAEERASDLHIAVSNNVSVATWTQRIERIEKMTTEANQATDSLGTRIEERDSEQEATKDERKRLQTFLSEREQATRQTNFYTSTPSHKMVHESGTEPYQADTSTSQNKHLKRQDES